MAEGELASVMTRQPTPDPMIPGSTYDWYSLAVFRLGNGRPSEHWGPSKKPAPGERSIPAGRTTMHAYSHGCQKSATGRPGQP
ncbi:hypothetical protein SGFS_035970 [Streptomyces graminofaciens]|uniref:Uncharacterized protein n=1 Tax=Streptomyces graminofaciens TaxID=68212 RepID=A0ABN5VG49_9ACTN|nr:hypothetical protein SGFS_035970 [Streptomyces graminofaciens]